MRGPDVYKVDADKGAVWFGRVDRALLTAQICEILDARIVDRENLVWVERLDLRSEDGSFPLFHDEDGSSHLELTALNEPGRARIVARLTGSVK